MSILGYLMSFLMITVRVQIYPYVTYSLGVERAAAEVHLRCFVPPALGNTLLKNGGKPKQQGNHFEKLS